MDHGLVVLGGPLSDEAEAEADDVVRATLARDSWSHTHLVIDTIESWTIKVGARLAELDRRVDGCAALRSMQRVDAREACGGAGGVCLDAVAQSTLDVEANIGEPVW